jgi:hypothetical protein
MVNNRRTSGGQKRTTFVCRDSNPDSMLPPETKTRQLFYARLALFAYMDCQARAVEFAGILAALLWAAAAGVSSQGHSRHA